MQISMRTGLFKDSKEPDCLPVHLAKSMKMCLLSLTVLFLFRELSESAVRGYMDTLFFA